MGLSSVNIGSKQLEIYTVYIIDIVKHNVVENNICIYISGTVNSELFIGKFSLWIKWKFES